MTTPDRVTITIYVPAVVHLSVGIIMALAACAAWWVHFALPTGHDYRGTASDIGLLAGCTTLGYWLWCAHERGRAEASKAIAEAAAREQRLLGALRDISAEVTENRSAIKELHDDIAAATGAVEALQDCYLAEGTALVLPADEEVPHEQALRTRRGPRSSSWSGALASSQIGQASPVLLSHWYPLGLWCRYCWW